MNYRFIISIAIWTSVITIGIMLLFTNFNLFLAYLVGIYLFNKLKKQVDVTKLANIETISQPIRSESIVQESVQKPIISPAITQRVNTRKEKKKPEWKRRGYTSRIAYVADKERRLRKREQDHYLAKSYNQRQGISASKKNLTVIDDLLKLSPIEFEHWVKEYIFEKDGWKVSETKISGDGGIDLILHKKNEHSIAQCKRYSKTLGEPIVRDFYGTMMSEGVSRGFLVTTGLFTLSALKFAEDKPIILMDRRVLSKKL